MTEIRVDVDLAHPPERVWRAFTEARVVVGWLPTATFLVRDDGRFTFRASGIVGLDEEVAGQVLPSEAPHHLIMRWEAPNLRTLVSVVVEDVPGGSRLTVAQRGFLGPQGTMRRRVLQRTYLSLLSGPLVAALDRLAAEEIAESNRPDPAKAEAARRNDGRAYQRLPRPRSASAPGLSSYVRVAAGPKQQPSMPGFAAAVLTARANGRLIGVAAVPPAVAPAAGSSRLSGRLRAGMAGLLAFWERLRGGPGWSAERRSQAVAAAAALLLLLAMVALLVGRATTARPPRPPQVGGGGSGALEASVPGVPSPQVTAVPVEPAPSASGPPTASAQATVASAVALTAAYSMERNRVSGYNATITIRNAGSRPAHDWTVIVTLPLLDLRVHDVEGAKSSENGKQVVFVPVDATRTVPPGASVQLKFQVDGLGQPVACAIDGEPCSGLPE